VRLIVLLMTFLLAVGSLSAQNFDFDKIYSKADKYTVAVNVVIEVSFGTQTTDAENRGIGSIVSADGLVIFDGTPIDSEDPFSIMSGMQISAEPKSMEVVMMDGTRYTAEYIGIDRFTKIGFCRITPEEKTTFPFVEFKKRESFRVGEWLALYTLLPEYVTPQLGADVGLISANIVEPEEFVLTAGFNELEVTSVLYDSLGIPVGVLGDLENPALSGFDASSMMESFSSMEDFMPLLGVIDADRLNKLIADPPKKGKVDRGWMGIYLQALTSDIAEFWGVDAKGGIIINEVVKDSPADSAGMLTGDIIVELEGRPIDVDKEENLPVFQKKISELGAGASIEMSLLRRTDNGIDTLDVTFTLARAPISPAEAPEYEDTNFEIKIRDMVFADYNIFNLDPDFKGVVVKEVEPGGWAAVGGVMPGDILQSIEGNTIETIDDAQNALKQIDELKPEEVVFFIWRDSKTMFVNIKTDW